MGAAASQRKGLDLGAIELIGGGGSPFLESQHEQDLTFESRRQPVKGLDPEPCGLIGGGGSPYAYD